VCFFVCDFSAYCTKNNQSNVTVCAFANLSTKIVNGKFYFSNQVGKDKLKVDKTRDHFEIKNLSHLMVILVVPVPTKGVCVMHFGVGLRNNKMH